MSEKPEFTAHNILLDNGEMTWPDGGPHYGLHPWTNSVKRLLALLYPDPEGVRVADLGCLEGGWSVEIARMGFDVTGIEIRAANIAACNYVKAHTNLPNLRFVQDDVRNIADHGHFDVVLCSGLLHHLQEPRRFLETLGTVTNKALILSTHFAPTWDSSPAVPKFELSPLAENEGLRGRWFTEYRDDDFFSYRERHRWSSWDNRQSFWIQREHLLQAIQDVGFDMVLEQFDFLGPPLAAEILGGYYVTDARGVFIGMKSAHTS